ncbi:hypothetical protein [Embleya hyalina]|uniref:Secreted protein n=1 Tax=Embleya hyalina TaxID=516124 RepID=A0A401YEW4_9ACTN|nr:hypothetical protein [Embleya hyalina]GCD93129.1 hypothetical protein EHYA_00772 [Embleya hyalina]
MRRIAATCVTLAAAATLALTQTLPAYAATGTLYINRAEYTDPSGCLNSDAPDPLVYNRTDQVATVYLFANCTGLITGSVWPEAYSQVVGSSISIP